MNKTNSKSFAAKAKDLVNKYKRHKFDPVEKAELEAALSALAQEQEAYKAANGLSGNENNQYAQPDGQAMQQFEGPGNSFLPMNNPNNMFNPVMDAGITVDNNAAINPLTQQNVNTAYYRQFNPNAFKQDIVKNNGMPETASTISNPSKVSTGITPEYDLGSTQGILPSIVGGLGSIAGNYIMSKGVKPVTLNKTYSPEQISLARERAVIERQARDAGVTAMQSLRTAGNRGAYIGGVGTAIAGLNKGLSDATMDSFQKETMLNLDQRNKAMAMNADVDKYNAMMKYQADQDKQAYKSAMIKAIPETITDINKIQQQNAMLNTLASQYYGVTPGAGKDKFKNVLFGRQLKGRVK